MSADKINVGGGEPTVALTRIERISTFEVQEMELERLDDLVATENRALGFATFMAGALVSTVASWLGTSTLTATAVAVYYAMILTSLILSLWFGLSWWRAKQERPRLMTRLRGGANALAASAATPQLQAPK